MKRGLRISSWLFLIAALSGFILFLLFVARTDERAWLGSHYYMIPNAENETTVIKRKRDGILGKGGYVVIGPNVGLVNYSTEHIFGSIDHIDLQIGSEYFIFFKRTENVERFDDRDLFLNRLSEIGYSWGSDFKGRSYFDMVGDYVGRWP